jgi:hypothetical protein
VFVSSDNPPDPTTAGISPVAGSRASTGRARPPGCLGRIPSATPTTKPPAAQIRRLVSRDRNVAIAIAGPAVARGQKQSRRAQATHARLWANAQAAIPAPTARSAPLLARERGSEPHGVREAKAAAAERSAGSRQFVRSAVSSGFCGSSRPSHEVGADLVAAIRRQELSHATARDGCLSGNAAMRRRWGRLLVPSGAGGSSRSSQATALTPSACKNAASTRCSVLARRRCEPPARQRPALMRTGASQWRELASPRARLPFAGDVSGEVAGAAPSHHKRRRRPCGPRSSSALQGGADPPFVRSAWRGVASARRAA